MFHRRDLAEDERRAFAPPPAPDEARLLAQIVARDLRAFEELYRIYHPRLGRFLGAFLRRPQAVEEALNDTMLVVWKRADSYDGTSKVSTWIFAIAYRTALKARLRQDDPQEDRQAEFRMSVESGPEQQLGERQTQAILLNALSQLSPDHRAVVDLTYFHDAGYREIADILDCPVGTVKTRMHHARRHLRDMLAGQLGDWL
jgi:RNA polymerase sigma-70 factor (ECF subfamily)